MLALMLNFPSFISRALRLHEERVAVFGVVVVAAMVRVVRDCGSRCPSGGRKS